MTDEVHMVESVYPFQRADIETHIMPDGTCLLFDVVGNEGRALNAAGALTWDYCDGTLSAGEIADELAALLPNGPQIRADTLALLAELAQSGYLVTSERALTSPAQ
ncbi:MAG TPA: PqqD family protein [Ktedonobacterales bacterium]|nr:PqqD family protein [Ktedonobacterales bacterium]